MLKALNKTLDKLYLNHLNKIAEILRCSMKDFLLISP
ncbi:helix-turn-helix domain-containing protein [Pedobacter sp. KBW06]